jgi:hypothetical protein
MLCVRVRVCVCVCARGHASCWRACPRLLGASVTLTHARAAALGRRSNAATAAAAARPRARYAPLWSRAAVCAAGGGAGGDDDEDLLERLSRIMGGGGLNPYGTGGRLDPFGSSSSQAWARCARARVVVCGLHASHTWLPTVSLCGCCHELCAPPPPGRVVVFCARSSHTRARAHTRKRNHRRVQEQTDNPGLGSRGRPLYGRGAEPGAHVRVCACAVRCGVVVYVRRSARHSAVVQRRWRHACHCHTFLTVCVCDANHTRAGWGRPGGTPSEWDPFRPGDADDPFEKRQVRVLRDLRGPCSCVCVTRVLPHA